MSSTDEDPIELTSQRKRKKITRACDSCRRRKIRCDERTSPHNKCSYCDEQELDCTYTGEPKKRGRPRGYAEALEKRIQLLEGLVKKLCPNLTMLHSLVYPLDPEYATRLTNIPASTSLTTSHSPCTIAISTTASTEKEHPDSVVDIIRKVASLSLGSQDDPFRDDHGPENENGSFFGKSSGAMLVRTVASLKKQYSNDVPITRRIMENGRLVCWKRLPWEKDLKPRINKRSFPPLDLITKLASAYFEHVNLFYPLLHRPTFDRAVENGLYLYDDGFGSVLFLVCAVGSQYTETFDERTLSEGTDSRFSAGWKWYNEVQVIKQSLFDPPTLYDLQSCCLAAVFLLGGYAPQAVWNLTAFGIRLAQDVGANRRRVPLERLTVDDELWKRAFWVLIALDRMVSIGIGRPCAIHDDNFDVDMPVECDDEYWENPDPVQRFRQPKDIPSTITAFNQHLRLYKIMAFAMTTIYSMKTKFWESISHEWERHILTELDSALNNWMSTLPDFLRWDPNRSDNRFFKLSGLLIRTFYDVQMVIHRPYRAIESQSTSLSLPSLAICTSAARSCSLVLGQQMKRTVVVYPYMQINAFKTGLVLLLHIWGSKRGGFTTDSTTTRQVETCIDVLRMAKDRWRSAAILLEILNGLTTAGQVLLPSQDNRGSGTVRTSDSNMGRPTTLGNATWPEEYPILSSSQTNLSSTDLYPPDPLPPVAFHHHYPFSENVEVPEPEVIYPDGHEQQANVFIDVNASYYQNSGSSVSEQDTSNHPFCPVDTTNAAYFEDFQQQAIVDSDTMEIWFNVPNGLEPDEWNSFFASFTN